MIQLHHAPIHAEELHAVPSGIRQGNPYIQILSFASGLASRGPQLSLASVHETRQPSSDISTFQFPVLTRRGDLMLRCGLNLILSVSHSRRGLGREGGGGVRRIGMRRGGRGFATVCSCPERVEEVT